MKCCLEWAKHQTEECRGFPRQGNCRRMNYLRLEFLYIGIVASIVELDNSTVCSLLSRDEDIFLLWASLRRRRKRSSKWAELRVKFALLEVKHQECGFLNKCKQQTGWIIWAYSEDQAIWKLWALLCGLRITWVELVVLAEVVANIVMMMN